MAKTVQERSAKAAAKLPDARREGIEAQGQTGRRASHGSNQRAQQGTDHQRSLADCRYENGLDVRRGATCLSELSAPRNRY